MAEIFDKINDLKNSANNYAKPNNEDFEQSKEDDCLNLRTFYGYEKLSNDSITFLTNTTCIYLAGSNLLTLDIENLKRKIIPIKTKAKIVSFKITTDKKQAILIENDSQKICSVLHVIDLDKKLNDITKKTPNKRYIKQVDNKLITTFSISNDNEILVCYASQPTLNSSCLIVFSFLKLEQLTEMNPLNNHSPNNSTLLNEQQTIEQVSFLPGETKRFLTIGSKLIKIFHYTNRSLKLVYTLDCFNYFVWHSWFSKHEFVALDRYGTCSLVEAKQGSVKLLNLISNNNSSEQLNFESSMISLSQNTSNLVCKKFSDFSRSEEFSMSRRSSKQQHSKFKNSTDFTKFSNKRYLSTLPSVNNSCCLICVKKGFFLTSQSDGVLYYHQANNDPYTFNLLCTIKLKQLQKQVDKSFKEFIIDLNVNEQLNSLIAVSNRKTIYFFDLKELFNFNSTNANSKSIVDFETLFDNSHFDLITCLDNCVRKPLIASCSIDRWLNIWNYDTNMVELKQNFDEDLLSVAFHPNGLYLLLGTTNSLKYMSVYLDACKIVHVLNVRSCANCVFAHGGHMFAFVHGTVVQIFSSIKFNEVGAIKAQEMGKVKQLRFSSDDHYLMCCSMAGIIRIWNAITLVPMCEIVTKGLSYIGLALHPNQEWLFLISTEKTIRQFQLPLSDEFKSMLKTSQPAKLIKKIDTKQDENVTCIEISKSGKFISIGTNKGYIRVYLIEPNNITSEREYRAHISAITKICITPSDECLIAAGEDGTLSFFQIGRDLRVSYLQLNQSNEDVLIDRDEFINKCNVLKEHEEKIGECRADTDFKLRIKELRFKIKIRDLKSRFNTQMLQLKEQIENCELENEKNCNDSSLRYEVFIKEHLKKFYHFDRLNKKRVEKECLKNHNLAQEISSLKTEISKNEAKLKEIESKIELKEYEESELKLDLKKQLHLNELNDLKKNIDNLKKFEIEFNEEIEAEALKIKIKHKIKLFNLNKVYELNKSELSKLRADLNEQKLVLNEILKNSQKRDFDLIEMSRKMKELDISEASIQLDNEKFDQVLIKKDLEIEKLVKNCEDLESVNENLERQIENLGSQINPVEEENVSIKHEINEVENELKEQSDFIARMSNEFIVSKLKVNSGFNELKKSSDDLNEKSLMNEKMLDSIFNLVKKAADLKETNIELFNLPTKKIFKKNNKKYLIIRDFLNLYFKFILNEKSKNLNNERINFIKELNLNDISSVQNCLKLTLAKFKKFSDIVRFLEKFRGENKVKTIHEIECLMQKQNDVIEFYNHAYLAIKHVLDSKEKNRLKKN